MQTVLIAIGTLLPMLLILVVIHELGHFFTARALGVKVLEFGVGFPPRAFGIFTGKTPVLIDASTQFINLPDASGLYRGQFVKVSSTEDADGNLVARVIEAPEKGKKNADKLTAKQLADEGQDPQGYLKHEGKIRRVESGSFLLADMLYSVNYAPLGGFVRLAGESDPGIPQSLASKSVGTRFLVLVAGPLMNAVLPILIFTVLLMMPQDITVGDVIISEVSEGSPAQAAGLEPGDIVLKADGHIIDNRFELSRAINLNGGSMMELLVSRDGREEIFLVRPAFGEDQWIVGVLLLPLANTRVESRSDPLWVAFPQSFVETWELLVLVKQTMFGAFAHGSIPEFSGPIGIAKVTGEVTSEGGLNGWLAIAILLSINLAILNILPIPMLDGGRLVFVGLEWVRRGKRVPPEKEGLVHLVGFAVLMSAIVVISINDVARIINGSSFLG